MKQILNNIRSNYTELVKNKIGYVDINSLENCQKNPQMLLYLFPLIEKTFIEVVKYNPVASPEVQTQGTYRTMLSLLEDPTSMLIFNKAPEGLLEFLKEIYSENGLRNKVIHHQKVYFKIDIIEALIEVFSILITYLNILEDTDIKNAINQIEFIDLNEEY